MIFPEHREAPEPGDPGDSLEARRQARFEETAVRQAAERRIRFDREYRRQYGPPEGRHSGEDGGAHHWPAVLPDGTWPPNVGRPAGGTVRPGLQARPRCGCGCEDAGPAPRGTPVDGLLDQLARQRDADPLTSRERGRAEARAWQDAAAGPLSWPEAMSRLQEMSGRPLDGREALAWLNAHRTYNGGPS
jgi:hypothetical protein